ncbi:Protein of unknown function [Micromonospora krabiensis]|uniref:DUF3152 domain-containing protein n=2 Tax=Micromonospora krabiensis TaxID=307121 RepID=A0A1C3N4S3_9ACTN|nr:Protein of unknown function [Micromonospora krabiensis]
MGVVVASLWTLAGFAWNGALSAAPQQPVRYAPPAVEIDTGVDLDLAEVAVEVDWMVNDPRGWRVDLDQFTLRIVEPGIGGTTSMDSKGHIGMAYDAEDLALITEEAWTVLGPRFAAVGGTLQDQRTWIVLHELGHLLGHPHVDCPAAGQMAPVMRGANFELGDCTYNVWPHPMS